MRFNYARTYMLCTLLLPSATLAWQPIDLYPHDQLRVVNAAEPTQRGRTLVKEVQQKMYAYQREDATDVAALLHVELRDDWHGEKNEHIPPWPPTGQRLELRFSPRSIYGEIEFSNGSLASVIWGIEGKRQGSWGCDIWQCFERDSKGVTVSDEDQDKAFLVNAYSTIFELPHIIAKAPFITVITQGQHSAQENIECVFATWQSAKPQMENEQFLVWIDPRSRRIKKAHYTLRALAPDASAELSFISFAEDARGIFPTQIECVLRVNNQRYTHRIFVEQYRWEKAQN